MDRLPLSPPQLYWYGEAGLFQAVKTPLQEELGELELRYSDQLPKENKCPQTEGFHVISWKLLGPQQKDCSMTHHSRGLYCLILITEEQQDEALPSLLEGGCDFFILSPGNRMNTRSLTLRIINDLQRVSQLEEYKELLDLQSRQTRNLVESLPDIVYQLDEEGYFSYVNPAIAKLGYTPEEITGRHFSTLVAPDEVPLVSRRVILLSFSGLQTGDDFSPGLFDERRGFPRRTEKLEVRLKVNPAHPQSRYQPHRIGSVTAYGEICCRGFGPWEERDPPSRGTLGIIRDITDEKERRRHLHMLFQGMDQTPEMAVIINRESRLEYANPAFFRTFGLAPGDSLENEAAALSEKTSTEETTLHSFLKNALFSEGKQTMEFSLPRKDEEGKPSTQWFRVESSPITGTDNLQAATLFLLQNITPERTRADEQKKELDQKRRLLDEIHHRIKNNLQVVSSFLRMQETKLKHPDDVMLLRESQARIRSMSLIHDHLNRTVSKAHIPMAPFLRSLTSHLLDLYSTDNINPQIILEVGDLELDIDHITPLSLLINEILSNSLKYAFPPGADLKGRSPSLIIRQTGGDNVPPALIMGDNGIGLSPKTEKANRTSLGLTLIEELSQQMGSHIKRLNEPGTLYRLTLPEPPLRD